MSNLIGPTENTRLDQLTAYNSTIIAHLQGAELDAALDGTAKRLGKSDRDFRAHTLNNTHPDDLFAALATKGLTLAKYGISQIAL